MTVLLEDAPPTTRNTAPTPYRWTLSKFHRLVESGLFTDRKVMMIDGKILEMPVDNPPHVTGVSLAVQLLQRAGKTGLENDARFFSGRLNRAKEKTTNGARSERERRARGKLDIGTDKKCKLSS